MKNPYRSASLILATISSLAAPCLAQRGPVPGFNASTPYLIHYGNWTTTLVTQAKNNYKMVILHPTSNITSANIASIRTGPDNISGNADDVKVFGYISVGEDDRPNAPFEADGNGPRVDPRGSYSGPLTDSIDPLGKPSPTGTGYASYYLDDNDFDGNPDQNSTFGGYYVNPGDPAWYQILKTKTKATDGRAGIQELLTTTYGAGYGCDGLFMDTLDTPAPNSFGATYFEWTAKGYRDLVKKISDDNPTKLLIANRGVFFYNPNLKPYAYTLRPYINMLMFESYYTDSSGSGMATAFFDDNKFNFAPKINAEANRPDGFTVISLGYTTPGEPAGLGAQDFVESQREQGWMLYRTNPSLDGLPFNTQAATWNAANPDVSAPVWKSTAATGADSDPVTSGNQAPAARIGIQQAAPGNGSVTVRWDVASDQSGPIKYNLYYTSASTLNFSTATKVANVAPSIPANYRTGTGAQRYPYEYVVTGLQNGTVYKFAVRAEDALAHEETNTAILESTPTAAPSQYRSISVDGNDADWNGVPVIGTDPAGDGVQDIVSIQVANDQDYLYVLVRYNGTVDTNTLNGSPSIFLSLDNDSNASTGFNIYGLNQVGAEVSWQNDFPFAQSASSYNLDATFTNGGIGISPYASTVSFQEYRIPRNATYTIGSTTSAVFPNPALRLAFWTNDATAAEFAGAVDYTFAQPPPTPSNFANIVVDGDFSDWDSIPVTHTDASTDGTPDIVSVKTANDNDYLYLLVTYSGAVDTNGLNGSPSVFLSLDNDATTTTGFNIYGLGQVGAEISWQNDFPFAQSASSFNLGATVTNGAAGISPYSSNTTQQEYRIARNATYSIGTGPQLPVFPQNLIRLAFWSDGSASEFAGGFNYVFAAGTAATPYQTWKTQQFTSAELSDPLVSGDLADFDRDGLNTLLEFALGGNPKTPSTSLLPSGKIGAFSGTNHLEFTYLRRTPLSGLAYKLETSANLATWNSTAAQFVEVSVTPATTGFESVRVRLASPVSAGRTFIRLNVSQAP